MSDAPWLTIIGFGEDGRDGLTPTCQAALDTAEIVMAPPRHLELAGDLNAEVIPWPVPYADGIARLLTFRGRRVAVLASGDPFWFGAGTSLTRHLEPGEWVAHPAPSTFSRAAAVLGWPLERTTCLGLHAAPLARMRPHLAPGARLLVLLRDGAAVGQAARALSDLGFGPSPLTVLEALGGPRERVSRATAETLDGTFTHPVCLAIEVAGPGAVMSPGGALPDAMFETDGQLTKQPIRALTLAALSPRPGERLWDIGGGSGSIAIEWLRSHPANTATCIEAVSDRAARIRRNADALGQDRLSVVEGVAPEALTHLPRPDAVFIGGGISEEMLAQVTALCPRGTRLVANGVTLEAESLLAKWHGERGGELMRIDIARGIPLGGKRGWKAAYPIVQWSVAL